MLENSASDQSGCRATSICKAVNVLANTRFSRADMRPIMRIPASITAAILMFSSACSERGQQSIVDNPGPTDSQISQIVSSALLKIQQSSFICVGQPGVANVSNVTVLRRGAASSNSYPVEVSLSYNCKVFFSRSGTNYATSVFRFVLKRDDFGDWLVIPSGTSTAIPTSPPSTGAAM